LLCEKTGTIALMLLGLMEDWMAGRQADKILLNLENFKINFILDKILTFLVRFLGKAYPKIGF